MIWDLNCGFLRRSSKQASLVTLDTNTFANIILISGDKVEQLTDANIEVLCSNFAFQLLTTISEVTKLLISVEQKSNQDVFSPGDRKVKLFNVFALVLSYCAVQKWFNGI